jgi:7,8-dihydropterin-6-yl-methyl-4-(beta-D-ribofuranosyl)aminobenzene 5'-phosphate synthase
MTQFMKLLLAGTITVMLMTTAAIGTAAAAGPDRITILYDAFGKDASMRKDWGFSALVEIAGKPSAWGPHGGADPCAER